MTGAANGDGNATLSMDTSYTVADKGYVLNWESALPLFTTYSSEDKEMYGNDRLIRRVDLSSLDVDTYRNVGEDTVDALVYSEQMDRVYFASNSQIYYATDSSGPTSTGSTSKSIDDMAIYDFDPS